MKYQVSVKLHKNFIEVKGGAITVGVMAPPEKGKANEEVIRKIAEYFGVPRSGVKIISGRASRKKIVDIFFGKI
ncbi:MAG: DUF167 domain-containing protein [Candidatus Sungbacteria bacterium]|nr:DUF167 domain-containing protein [Candidatus Sungbacteria bacterium]